MSLAYFPLYPDDFEADTAHLTLAEDGAYNRLLRLCWRTPGCSLPVEREWIYRRMRAHSDDDRRVVDTVLEEFFTVSEGRLTNARIAREWTQANAAHKRRKFAGRKGGSAKALKNNETEPSNATAMLKQPEPEPEPLYNSFANAHELMPPNRKTAKRGSRLPDDWTLPDGWRDWATKTLDMPARIVAVEADKFRDYWTAKAGKDATKVDWEATWRNWCRNSGPRGPTKTGPASIPKIKAKLPEGYK
jgi:uncharacterized protein YdaU (DUF1376 family)